MNPTQVIIFLFAIISLASAMKFIHSEPVYEEKSLGFKKSLGIGKVLVKGAIGAAMLLKKTSKPVYKTAKFIKHEPSYVVKPVTTYKMVKVMRPVEYTAPVMVKSAKKVNYKPYIKIGAVVGYKALKIGAKMLKKSFVNSKKMVAVKMPKPKFTPMIIPKIIMEAPQIIYPQPKVIMSAPRIVPMHVMVKSKPVYPKMKIIKKFKAKFY